MLFYSDKMLEFIVYVYAVPINISSLWDQNIILFLMRLQVEAIPRLQKTSVKFVIYTDFGSKWIPVILRILMDFR